MSKVKPTKAMVDYRKKLAQKQKDLNEKIQDFNAKSQLEQAPLKKKLAKLKQDRELAAEAVIGYGLAMKALEENMREIEQELIETEQSINKDRPAYRNTFDDFRVEFGFYESEVDWGKYAAKAEGHHPTNTN